MTKALRTHKWIPGKTVASFALAGLALLSSACGKQAFQATSTLDQSQAPGTFVMPAKVDLLLVQDDTGSMREVFSEISQQMSSFLEDLGQRGWDYHFATIPLTQYRAINQVQASRYDINWGSQWLAPFPGAIAATLTGQVQPSAFRLPENYDAFLTGNEVANLSGLEPGFKNINYQLRVSNAYNTGFLRKDAMLAVFVVGNGNDTTEINYCTSNGMTVPCSDNSATTSFNKYRDLLKGVKADPAQIKFYAAVANNRYTRGECNGANTYVGTRYQQMASALGGASFDICNQSVSSVFASLDDQLKSVRKSMRIRYLFIEEEPKNDSSLKVFLNIGGDPTNRVELPRSRVNGWDYVGYKSNVYAIDWPAQMNLTSGYAIELFGSAKLTGDDTATVESTPVYANDSVSK